MDGDLQPLDYSSLMVVGSIVSNITHTLHSLSRTNELAFSLSFLSLNEYNKEEDKMLWLRMSSSWCSSYAVVLLVVLVVVLPSNIVNGAVTCTRCKRKNTKYGFYTSGSWRCMGHFPPGSPVPDEDFCYTECNRHNYSPDEFTCQKTTMGDVISCFCKINRPPPICPAGQKTTAYRCDETLYVCWNLVPPQVLDLWDDTGNDCPLTQSPITDLVYCDVGDVAAYLVEINEVDLCGQWCKTAASATTCPNGKAIDERFHITAPTNNGDGFWPKTGNSRGKANGDVGFCDYGGEYLTDGWIVDRPVDYTCPADVERTVDNDPGTCQAVVSYAAPECQIGYKLIDGYESGTVFNVANDPIPLIFDNANGRCTITTKVIDVEPPTIECPLNIQVATTGKQCFSVVTYSTPVASDNCGLNQQATVIGYPSGSIFPAGITLIEAVATDSSGNTGRCSFQVQVTTDPSIDCSNVPILSCPTNMVVTSEPGNFGAVVEYSVTAQYPSNAFVTIEPVREKGGKSGSLFSIGTSEMLFTASLGLNQGIVTCQFTVTVQEAEHFVILGKQGKNRRNNNIREKKTKNGTKMKKGKKPKKGKGNLVRVRSLYY
jgi:HYR domain